MKLVKTSAIAVAISALLAGPVLAQGASSDTQVRGGDRGRVGGARMTRKATAKTGTKGTVGAGSGTPKVTGGAIAPATGR